MTGDWWFVTSDRWSVVGGRSSMLEDVPDEATGLNEVREIWAFGTVYRGWNCHYKEIGLPEGFRIIGNN